MINSELLFSYGTLQDEGVQLATFGRRLIGQKDALPGHRLGTLTITKPDVVGLSGIEEHRVVEPTGRIADSVEGVVFEITLEELIAAEAYEEADYRRMVVQLASGLEAWLYVRA
jgi:gamma-glutamylcyclotransferase (GGCT)/AIG2-like uncharacterized protein YtfP